MERRRGNSIMSKDSLYVYSTPTTTTTTWLLCQHFLFSGFLLLSQFDSSTALYLPPTGCHLPPTNHSTGRHHRSTYLLHGQSHSAIPTLDIPPSRTVRSLPSRSRVRTAVCEEQRGDAPLSVWNGRKANKGRVWLCRRLFLLPI